MKETPNNAVTSALTEAGSGLESRMFRTMSVAVALAVVGSLPFANWKVTAGLLLGGLLSLLNHRWLNKSATAAFSVLVHGAKPRLSLVQYILRYAVVGGVVFVACQLNLVSPAATFGGLSTFVVAFFVEAFREVYLSIIHREEII